MRHVFSEEGLAALDRAVSGRLLVGLDFDGTLAPIVAERHRAAMPPGTRAALRCVARLFPTVVISGRALADVQRRLGTIALAGVVGNHGLEPSRAESRAARRVERWRRSLAEALAGFHGVVVEDKGLSLAVHYRHAPDKKAARRAIGRATAALPDTRVVPGKHVVNLVPAGAPHKGTALQGAWRRLRCEAALYVGDDDTDEDVFALLPRRGLLTVRVGRRAGSAAQYYLRDQREVERLLKWLGRAGERMAR